MLSTYIFWASALLLVYLYAGYPILIHLWARLRPRHSIARDIQPRISILVVAHNEGHRLARRLENLLALEYPVDRVDVLVGSDGSNDGTDALSRGFRHPRLRIFNFPTRRGKAAVLNDLVKEARGEILVMADARQRFATDAIAKLVRHFADPAVGAVSGELVLTRNVKGTAVGEGVGFYWRYEKLIRSSESLTDSTVGVTGAIYAIRKELFEPLPEDIILDDVLIPIRIVARGYRVLFEPKARAYDRAAGTAAEEFKRKVRTIAGNFQLLSRETWLLSPLRNRLWLQTLSHKGLRLIGPLLLIAAFGANLALLSSPFYTGTLLAQVTFYLAALGGFLLRDARRRIRALIVPYTVCLLNWATAVALFRFLTQRQSAIWEAAAPVGLVPGPMSAAERAATRWSA
jgi:cellulose synthase/poly-beta-1,6-N-acetylglucosamine synthase-like glycosyltransferase